MVRGLRAARPHPRDQSEARSAPDVHDICTSSRAHANVEIKKSAYMQCGELN
jgi:hypothetical protein